MKLGIVLGTVALTIILSGCVQVKPSSSSDPIKRLDDIMDSSGYFFPRPQPNGGDAYGATIRRYMEEHQITRVLDCGCGDFAGT